ncbi:MAG: DUF420 domain-containing protein [Flavobacteriaceae bacterium]|nr:DUF420 domain-containing protein [Flavobacteriaceae bacterium]
MITVKKYTKTIVILSIVIPIAVAALFVIDLPYKLPIFLPPIYATINAITALLLVTAVWAIKNKKQKLHEILMKSAIGLSVLFLILYIIYHITSEDTKFGGNGFIRYFYFFILISHIILSIIVIPFVLTTFVSALNKDFKGHKKIARIAFPIWVYVAVTGVIVYLMIKPYYVF